MSTALPNTLCGWQACAVPDDVATSVSISSSDSLELVSSSFSAVRVHLLRSAFGRLCRCVHSCCKSVTFPLRAQLNALNNVDATYKSIKLKAKKMERIGLQKLEHKPNGILPFVSSRHQPLCLIHYSRLNSAYLQHHKHPLSLCFLQHNTPVNI